MAVSVFVVDRVVVVADSVVVTVFVRDVAVVVVVSAAAVAVVLLVVVAGVVVVLLVVVAGVVVVASDGVVVEADVSVGALGRLTLAVLLVICVSVFEMLLAMLEAPPEPHPATSIVTRQSHAT